MKKKLIIIIIIMCMVLLGVGCGFAYFVTRESKTDKELFLYYLTKNDGKSEVAEIMNKYFAKKGESSYKTKGKAELNVSGAEDDEEIQMLNDSKLTFEGKKNPAEKMTEQEITAVLGMGINVPLKYKQDGDLFAVQTNLLTSKYIGFKNENLDELAKKIGIESEEIPNKINFEQSDIKLDNVNEIKDKYKKIILDNLPDESAFSKETNGNKTIITATMTYKEIVQLSKELLKQLRNEELIVKKAKENNIELKEYYDSIDSLIKELDNIENKNGKAEIKLYIEKDQVTGFDILIYEENDILAKITAEINNDKLKLNMNLPDQTSLESVFELVHDENDVAMNIKLKISADNNNMEFNGKIEYKNIFKLDNVEENYSFEVSGEMYVIEKIAFNYSNLVTFDEDIKIEKISEKNSYIINNMSEEDLQSFMIAIYQKLSTIQ